MLAAMLKTVGVMLVLVMITQLIGKLLGVNGTFYSVAIGGLIGFFSVDWYIKPKLEELRDKDEAEKKQ
jgi:hypothetical protein